MANDRALAEALRRADLITEAQLQTAFEYQESLGGQLAAIISKLGFVPEATLNEVVARCEHVHSIDLTGRAPDPELMQLIPRETIEKHTVLPFRQSEDSILLALSEATDFAVIEEIQFLTNCKVDTALAPRSQIRERIARYYREQMDIGEEPITPEFLAAQLIARIADPTVAALAKVLIDRGVIDAEAWQRALEEER